LKALEDKFLEEKKNHDKEHETLDQQLDDAEGAHEQQHVLEYRAHMGENGVHDTLEKRRKEDQTRTYAIVGVLVTAGAAAVTLFTYFVMR